MGAVVVVGAEVGAEVGKEGNCEGTSFGRPRLRGFVMRGESL